MLSHAGAVFAPLLYLEAPPRRAAEKSFRTLILCYSEAISGPLLRLPEIALGARASRGLGGAMCVFHVFGGYRPPRTLL